MTQEQIISIFWKSTFFITEGEFSGKATKISAIDFIDQEITSTTGKQFSFSSLKPYLKDIRTISLEEAKEIYRLYWNSGESTGDSEWGKLGSQTGTGNIIYDVFRIWEGRDYVAGDRVEWCNVLEYCIEHSIDVFDLIKKEEAVKL